MFCRSATASDASPSASGQWVPSGHGSTHLQWRRPSGICGTNRSTDPAKVLMHSGTFPSKHQLQMNKNMLRFKSTHFKWAVTEFYFLRTAPAHFVNLSQY